MAVASLAAAAWAFLIVDAVAGGAGGGHPRFCGLQLGSVDVGAFLLSWPVMVAAMMLPELAFDVRERERCELPGPKALGAFLAGYFVLWEIAGLAFLAAAALAARTSHAAAIAAPDADALGIASLALVAVAQFASARFVGRMRSTISPGAENQRTGGWRAGWSAGKRSLHCCWGLMTFMTVAELHDPLSVAAFAVLAVYIRHGRFGIPAANALGFAALADALLAVTLRIAPL